MKPKLLLLSALAITIQYSCNEVEDQSVRPQTKETIKTDSVKADSTSDSLDWYHLENVKPLDYNFYTDRIPVYDVSYNNIYVGNILYVDASTLQSPKFVSGINYLEKLDIICEYDANFLSVTDLPSYEVTHNIINKLPNDIEQNNVFSTSSPEKLNSLKALHFYSEAKFGMPLDEVFFSDGYKNHSKDNREFQLYMLYLNVCHVCMDYPMGKLLSNNFSDEEKANMGIISSINIGKTGYMIIDSDNNCVIITFESDGKAIITRGGIELKSSFSTLFSQQKLRLIDYNIQRLSDYALTELKYHVDMR
ncbi:hypothetical protein [Segatella paludivivens]|uniref:hypothetical protein n=1 Tax=Segatella paludivivens TaxID=185294 RepID=UPI00035ECB61|nr:hypothetical protein [Segatella paludivivens]